jgi:hypothetical protein
MPEPPDFERLAEMIVSPQYVPYVVDQLREVWNARGLADQHAVETRLSTLTGWVTSEPYRQHLRDAIAMVDRT